MYISQEKDGVKKILQKQAALDTCYRHYQYGIVKEQGGRNLKFIKCKWGTDQSTDHYL